LGGESVGTNLVEGHRVERACDILGSLKLCRAFVTKEASAESVTTSP